MERELWLFTMRFPYGNGEAFLENELPYLVQRFRHVRIFPLEAIGSMRPLPEQVQVEPALKDQYAGAGLLDLIRQAPLMWRIYKVLRADAPSAAVFKRRWPDARSRLRQALKRTLDLRRVHGDAYDPACVSLYSYWTSDWATVLSLWRAMDPRVRFCSRMMGFDMFAHRAPDGWQSLQAFHLQQVDRVYAISKAGLSHLTERHPQHTAKYRLSHLATQDHGPGPWSPSATLRVASCSNLVGLKRVHLIAAALGHIQGPVEWTHFGDGPERERVEAVVRDLPSRVQVQLKGSTPNKDIIAWYREHPVDLFVHASETEGGAPVALQEAASFGIPLIGCDAGGIPEIVTHRTGTLLPVDSSATELAVAMVELYKRSDQDLRDAVRKHWGEHFRADVVYKALADELATG
ncbi:MAG: glycosyltransferase [Flavobacteriales bacterium]|nr:glycosyltransferase [Flavobacteriales bacterium]